MGNWHVGQIVKDDIAGIKPLWTAAPVGSPAEGQPAIDAARTDVGRLCARSVADRPTGLRIGLAQVVDAAAAAMVALMLWGVLFDTRPFLDDLGMAVGVLGILAAWMRRQRVRTPVDVPLAVYVGLTLVSAIAHGGRLSPTIARQASIGSWPPATHAVALAVYFYGASSVLRTRRRLGVLVGILVVGVSIIGIQAGADHIRHGLSDRMLDYPSVMQWSGYAGLGLLFALVLPLALAPAVVSRSVPVVLASVFVALVLALDLGNTYSRGANVCAGITYVALSLVEVRTLKSWRLITAAGVGALCVAAALGASVVAPRALTNFATGRMYVSDPLVAYESRIVIWGRVVTLIREHPGLGVGPGNYSAVMRGLYLRAGDPYDPYGALSVAHGHSTVLHLAAECGIPVAAAFLLIWWRLLTALYRVCTRTWAGVLAIGVFGALLTFFTRSLTDHFLSDLVVANRAGFLLWTLFAAAVAIARLPRLEHWPLESGRRVSLDRVRP